MHMYDWLQQLNRQESRASKEFLSKYLQQKLKPSEAPKEMDTKEKIPTTN